MNFSHTSTPSSITSLSPPLLSVKLSSSAPSAPKRHNCSTRLTPVPRHQQRWCTSAAPILITLGEHTCENRCPPGLACCSSLGWSVCGWLSATPPPPPPLLRVSQVPSRADLAPTPRQEEPTAASGRGAGSTGPPALPPALFILILVLLTEDNEKVWSKMKSFSTPNRPDMVIYYEVQNQF